MHYKNGREAKNGDKIVRFTNGVMMVGYLHDAVPGNDQCNGYIAAQTPNDFYANLSECLHFDDVNAALAGGVPDTSKAADVPTPA